MQRALFLSLVCGVAAGAASGVAAQDCGDWSRPVVCRAEVIAVDGDGETERLGTRDDLQVAPRGKFELEVEARDQRGSRFPLDRLVLAADDSRCDRLLTVRQLDEGRLEVTAAATEGRCELRLWLPNNTNFEWEIEVQISADARAGYERDEAEFLARALYAAILNREPDAGGFSGAVTEIQRGDLDAQIAAMTRSAEFQQLAGPISPAELLDQFYQGILGRPSDSDGVREYLGEMQRRQYASVLSKLIRSAEFERRLAQ